MERLIKAFHNSVRAFRSLIRTEAAFQQEMALLVLSLPVGWFLSTSWRGYALLVGSLLLLLVVEVLNTGIEATCNAVRREFDVDIQLAKDCGSLAVLMTSLLAGGVWVLALIDVFAGLEF